MSKLDEGQCFINNKPLKIADQINWKAFNEEMDKNMLKTVLESEKKKSEKFSYPGLLHISRHL